MRHWTESPLIKETTFTDQELINEWNDFTKNHEKRLERLNTKKIEDLVRTYGRRIQSEIEEISEMIQQFSTSQCAKTIHEVSPELSQSQKCALLTRFIQECKRRYQVPKNVKNTKAYGRILETESFPKNRKTHEQIIKIMEESKSKLPDLLNISLIQMFRESPTYIIAGILDIESLPEEITQKDWGTINFEPFESFIKRLRKTENQLEDKITYIKTVVFKQYDHIHKGNIEAIKKYKNNCVIMFQQILIYKFREDLIKILKPLENTGLSGLKETLKDAQNRTNIPYEIIFEGIFQYILPVYEYEKDPKKFLKNAEKLNKELKNNPNRDSVSWGKIKLPVKGLNIEYLQYLTEPKGSELETIEAWNCVFGSIIDGKKFEEFLDYNINNKKTIQYLLRISEEVIQHQKALTQNFRLVYAPKAKFDFETKFHTHKQIEKEKKTEVENQRALEEWKTTTQEVEEDLTKVQIPEQEESTIQIHYCQEREPQKKDSFLISSSGDPESKNWLRFLKKVKCPDLSPVSLWNAIFHVDEMNTQTLALVPYDECANGLHWKKIKRGAYRIFFYKGEDEWFVHVMNRKNWSWEQD